LLRPSILLAGAAALGAWLLATAAPATASGLAPDPPPAADVRPDPYPAAQASQPPAAPAPTRQREIVVTPAAAPVAAAPRVQRHRAAPRRSRQAPAAARRVPGPQRPLPFPTLSIKWFSAEGASAGAGGPDARVALVLAALVLASSVLVAAVAREAAR
jgi:hypothetical protein